MGDSDDRQAGNAQMFGLCFAEREEFVGANGGNGNSTLFQFYGIMDTP